MRYLPIKLCKFSILKRHIQTVHEKKGFQVHCMPKSIWMYCNGHHQGIWKLFMKREKYISVISVTKCIPKMKLFRVIWKHFINKKWNLSQFLTSCLNLIINSFHYYNCNLSIFYRAQKICPNEFSLITCTIKNGYN